MGVSCFSFEGVHTGLSPVDHRDNTDINLLTFINYGQFRVTSCSSIPFCSSVSLVLQWDQIYSVCVFDGREMLV